MTEELDATPETETEAIEPEIAPVSFPISIALVGAPGSGKSKIADAFATISADFFTEHESELTVITNAGNVLENVYDVAMGVFGGYAEDLRAYHVQFETEQMALREGKSFLTLGTSLENIAHAGVTLENLVTGLQTPDVVRRANQQQVTMSLLTHLFAERFRYSFGFYVPYTAGALVVPGEEDPARAYGQRIDTALRIIMNQLGFRIQVLDQPTVEEQAQVMFDTIKEIVENGPRSFSEVLEETEAFTEVPTEVPPVAEPTLAE